MLSDNPSMAAARSDLKTLGKQEAEAGRVEVGAGAEDALLRQSRELPRDVREHVH